MTAIQEQIHHLNSTAFLYITDRLYRYVAHPLIESRYPGEQAELAHEKALAILSWLDESTLAQTVLGLLSTWLWPERQVEVGGVTLNQPIILAPGLIKGHGFADETTAMAAVQQEVNIIPGWQTMPHFTPLIEFGSYTRYPRLGNSSPTLIRDAETHSTWNRIGLKNPGARATAEFLSQHLEDLPEQFGISLAFGPEVHDLDQQITQVLESIAAFIDKGIYPSWFTINPSCPNTEADPNGNQTVDKIAALSYAVVQDLKAKASDVGREIPVWVKLGPTLPDEQYLRLLAALDTIGVKAAIVTNTDPETVPQKLTPSYQDEITAGVSGHRLHSQAVHIAQLLTRAKHHYGYNIDLIGCGGIEDKHTFEAFGTKAGQYLTALIFRGPLAGAYIANQIR